MIHQNEKEEFEDKIRFLNNEIEQSNQVRNEL